MALAGAGGAGAGGAGAGGAGAGGAGAGGAGAGGAGAGGAGAGGAGHAGGPTSMPLSSALAVTHDASVGFWATDPKVPNQLTNIVPTQGDKPNRGYDDLTYLSYDRRAFVVGGTLASQFWVGPLLYKEKSKKDEEFDTYAQGSLATVENDGATLWIQGVPVVSLERPDEHFFKQQLRFVRNYADLRMDRIPEIHTQISDLISFLGASYRLDVGQRRHSLEFLEMVHGLVIQLEMRIKHRCWAPRPIDLSPNVHPIIQTPVHSTFPSGHATESFALATVLHRLATDEFGITGVENLAMPFRIAHRIAVNRTVAGVHFPVDSAAGAILGVILGDAIYSMCATPGGEEKQWNESLKPVTVPDVGKPVYTLNFPSGGKQEDAVLGEDEDFTLQWMNKVTSNPRFTNGARDDRLKSVGDPILFKMWELAKSEWLKNGK